MYICALPISQSLLWIVNSEKQKTYTMLNPNNNYSNNKIYAYTNIHLNLNKSFPRTEEQKTNTHNKTNIQTYSTALYCTYQYLQMKTLKIVLCSLLWFFCSCTYLLLAFILFLSALTFYQPNCFIKRIKWHVHCENEIRDFCLANISYRNEMFIWEYSAHTQMVQFGETVETSIVVGEGRLWPTRNTGSKGSTGSTGIIL